MPVFNAVLTNQAEDAALDYDNTQIALQITHVGFGTSTAVADLDQLSVLGEVGRVAVAGGGIEPNSRTMTANVIWTPDQVRDIGQIGFYAGDTLFCIYAPGTAIVRVTPDVGIAASFSVSLVRLPDGSVNVVVDDSLSPLMLLMGQHLTNPDPHGQYAMKAAFNSHVIQNGVEHANLLAMIQAVNQRVANLEIREEIQIGEFVITDDPRNPVLYKGYGSWRLVPDVLLKGLDFDGTVGQFSQVAAGSDQSVRTTFFWQRFDPSVIAPLRTISISADSTDVNLLVLFTATCGAPVIGERIKFVVESDVLVTASTTSNYAIVTGDWPPDSDVSMDVFGIVAGRGGDGGNGGNCHASFTGSGDRIVIPQDATNGGNGGPAILADSQAITILNNGVICGGGCGGGGGSARTAKTNAVQSFNNMGICGSGGGGGWPYGSGGNGGAIVNGSSESADRQGNSGANAGRLDSGDGGVSVSNFSTTGGNGGNGGSLGAVVNISDGGSGGGGTASASAGAGGLVGIAITGPVTVTGNPVLGR